MSNRGKISISKELVHRALKLPDDAVITSMLFNPNSNTLDIYVEHSAFPQCDEGSYCFQTSINIEGDGLVLRTDAKHVICCRCQSELDEELRQEIDN